MKWNYRKATKTRSPQHRADVSDGVYRIVPGAFQPAFLTDWRLYYGSAKAVESVCIGPRGTVAELKRFAEQHAAMRALEAIG